MRTTPISEPEYRTLAPYLKKPWHLVFAICWESGLRIGEVLELQREHVAPDGLRGFAREKSGVGDFVPLSAGLLEQLTAWRHWNTRKVKGSPYLFQSKRTGGRYTVEAAQIALKVAAKRAGLPTWHELHPHLFRHAVGWRLANMDLGLTPLAHRKVVQKALGHKSHNSTEAYFVPPDTAAADALRLLQSSPAVIAPPFKQAPSSPPPPPPPTHTAVHPAPDLWQRLIERLQQKPS